MTRSTSEGGLLRVAIEGTSQFEAVLATLEGRGQTDLAEVEPQVAAIIEDVRSGGDRAVSKYVEQFEQRRVATLLDDSYDGESALDSLSPGVQRALRVAADRIEAYHTRQRETLGGFEYESDGVTLASRVTPLARVGVYAPGGKAYYPSTVLMAAIPARVAGVREIYVATPSPIAEVRAACHLAGVRGILDAGGAHAIAAFAYGTETVPRVDKIVGPGNLYVAAAKRLVFGKVGIDSIAGPTEILVLADDDADASLVAADLLSQAEHDEAAYPLLACTSARLIDAIRAEIGVQVATLPRRKIAEASLSAHGVAFQVNDRAGLTSLANRLAAEHVAIHARDARKMADSIERAGALFVGPSTPEAAGDYVAGPSHVLPTGGSARFAAPLGVYDFVSRSSLIEYRSDALRAQAEEITELARAEGLEAHARAVEARLAKDRS